MSDLGVAVPFYAGLDYLRRALDSLQRQSSPAWHAVVVDDAGPEPEAARVVADLADPRIRYVRNEVNVGLARNWNACFELVESDVVSLFHADDELEPDYVESVLQAHARHPDAVAVHTRASVIGASGGRIFSLPDIAKRFTGPRSRGEVITQGDEGLAVILRGSFIFCPALAYQRRLLPARPFDPEWRFVVDLHLVARLLFDGQSIVRTANVGYRYRRHGGSQTALLTESRDRFREEFALYGELAARAERHGWRRTAAVARRARIVRAHVAYRVASALTRGHLREARSTLSLLGYRTR